ncbi:hypothetical protein B0H14DRAFT_3009988, partial [Mycena olivaceomarginata]
SPDSSRATYKRRWKSSDVGSTLDNKPSLASRLASNKPRLRSKGSMVPSTSNRTSNNSMPMSATWGKHKDDTDLLPSADWAPSLLMRLSVPLIDRIQISSPRSLTGFNLEDTQPLQGTVVDDPHIGATLDLPLEGDRSRLHIEDDRFSFNSHLLGEEIHLPLVDMDVDHRDPDPIPDTDAVALVPRVITGVGDTIVVAPAVTPTAPAHPGAVVETRVNTRNLWCYSEFHSSYSLGVFQPYICCPYFNIGVELEGENSTSG